MAIGKMTENQRGAVINDRNGSLRTRGMRRMLTGTAAAVLLLIVAIAATWFAYAPGLAGGFVFDDFGNLPAIGATGPVTDWSTFARYMTSGTAYSTGRPLAMLSFLLDARDWPAEPYPFKRTNVILHIGNGVILALLLMRLGRARDGGRTFTRTAAAASLTASIWLLHPLLVSTTLYVVQREAMLAGTCVLVGLHGWLTGRREYAGHVVAGRVWLIGSLWGMALVAVLAKANGCLLPVLALAIETTWLRTADGKSAEQRVHQAYKRTFSWLTGLPLGIIMFGLAYIGWRATSLGMSGVRLWTLPERLLTEPRVILDYCRLLFIPRAFTAGLFSDALNASTSLVQPWTTFPSIIALGLVIAAIPWLARHRPAIAAAIAFFLAGHLIESTNISLELYFEHRNYLPAMLAFWPACLWVSGADTGSNATPRFHIHVWMRAAIGLCATATLWVMTHANASVWGDQNTQAIVWARLNPGSIARKSVQHRLNSEWITQHWPKLDLRLCSKFIPSNSRSPLICWPPNARKAALNRRLKLPRCRR